MGIADRSRARFAYWLIAPAVAFMVLVHLIPTAAGMYLSLLNLNTFTFQQLFGAPWAGLDNYDSILFDSANPLHSGFTNAASNTAFYTVWTVGLTLVLGLAIALLLNRSFPGNRVVRTLMLTPWVVPSFVVASLWQFMWQRDAGIINKLLVDYMGFVDERPTWLLGENTHVGDHHPERLARDPVRHADLHRRPSGDPAGAARGRGDRRRGPWQRFRHITLPLLRPLIAIQLLFGVIYSAYQFAIPYIMLGSNPGPYADLLMTLIIRQSFSNNLFGYGAAVSTLLMAAMFIWVAIWYRAFRRDLQAVR